jgi:uncharacterized iron-regulated membrane protein
MTIRAVHRWIALVVGPLLLLTALAGGVAALHGLAWRGIDWKLTLIEWHNLDILGRWATVGMAAGLLALASTGAAMWIQIVRRKWKRRKA